MLHFNRNRKAERADSGIHSNNYSHNVISDPSSHSGKVAVTYLVACVEDAL